MTHDAQLRIFRAENGDRAKAKAIIDAYCEEVGVIVRDTQAYFESYFNAGSGLWLAERTSSEGSDVVGCIVLRPLPNVRDVRAAEVKRLYVVPGARGLKIADKLLDELHSYAADVGYEWIYLDTKDDLKAAHKFYQRQGYEACERYNDNPQATIFMRRKV